MAYKEFSKQIHVENSEELVAEPIFCNQNILVGNRIFFFLNKNWIDKGVCHIKNMLNDNGTFMLFKSLKKNSELRQITLHILDVCKLSKATYVKQK